MPYLIVPVIMGDDQVDLVVNDPADLLDIAGEDLGVKGAKAAGLRQAKLLRAAWPDDSAPTDPAEFQRHLWAKYSNADVVVAAEHLADIVTEHAYPTAEEVEKRRAHFPKPSRGG